MAARPAMGAVAALLVLSCAGQALSEVKVSAALDTDYRYRGVSRSGSRPALTLGIGYEHPSGFYVGASAIAADTMQAGPKLVGEVEYAGYAWRDAAGRSWDVGVNNHDIEVYGATRRTLNYNDIYLGVAKNDLGAHLYYSPNYFARDAQVLYLDLNATVRRGETWRLLGHVGLLAPIGDGPAGAARRPNRLDVRAGVARTFRNGEVRLTYTAASPRPRPETPQSRPGLVLGTSVYF